MKIIYPKPVPRAVNSQNEDFIFPSPPGSGSKCPSVSWNTTSKVAPPMFTMLQTGLGKSIWITSILSLFTEAKFKTAIKNSYPII